MAKILIVDDEARIRDILSLVLREEGHRVETAGSAEEAIELQGAFEPEVVLLDLKLPGMQGLEALEPLRSHRSAPEVLVMTAYGTIRSAIEAIRLGAFDYLTKPFDNDELLILLGRVLEMRSLRSEVSALRSELESRYGFDEIIGISAKMQSVFRLLRKVAEVDATVAVYGESGTGKELVARAIHRRSPRADGPFVAVNCSAVPQTLFESEFFGHERGAFTGASHARAGLFEQATGGTLFLDEIGELPLEAQAKLLRALQERQVTRVGGRRTIDVDVRVIAATNRDLEAEMEAGRFRQDLFWRIHVVSIRLPPLRERREDLPLLIDHMIERFNSELGLSVGPVDPSVRRLLLAYDWPGNVRELENALCRAMVVSDGGRLTPGDLPARVRGDASLQRLAGGSGAAAGTLVEAVEEATRRVETAMILRRLEECGGNREATARGLGISRKTLFNKMRLYGIEYGGTEADGGG